MDNYIQQFKNGETICINSNSVKLQYNLVCAYNNVTLHTSVLYRFTAQDRWLSTAKYANYYGEIINQSIDIPTSTSGKVYLKNLNSDGYLYDLEIIANNSAIDNTNNIMNTILLGKDYIHNEAYNNSNINNQANNGNSNSNQEGNGNNNQSQDEHDYNWYKSQPLTFEIINVADVSQGYAPADISFKSASGSSNPMIIQVKKNNENWTTLSSDSKVISVNIGDIIQFRGDNNIYDSYNTASFVSTNCDINVYGNIMSLVNSQSYINSQNISQATFNGLFSGMRIINAKNLILPKTLLNNGCNQYQRLFMNCSHLMTPPVLPSLNLTTHCYEQMFYGCSSLTYSPVLPATSLYDANYCYKQMFTNCTNLKLVVLLAESLNNVQYANQNWLSNVSQVGNFIINNSADNSVKVGNATNDGVPSSWTIYPLNKLDSTIEEIIEALNN